jgi:nitronate monooxygenase
MLKSNLLNGRLRLPVIASPLFIISGPELVIAQCKAGIIGSFPALNARPASLLDEWLHRIREELDAHDRAHPEQPAAPFAVNQIVHKSNTRLDQDMEICVRHKVPMVITSLGAREDVNEAVHSYGGMTMHDVTNDFYAHKAIEKGADGLIAVASGAGGHAGSQSAFALIQEIREWWSGPLALSGAIAHGRAILAAEALGADFAYVGSAFIAAAEANALEAYKQMVVDSRAADIILTDVFTGMHGNYLRDSISRSGLDPENLKGLEPTMLDLGSTKAKPWKDIWGAGQGIGAVDAVRPVSEMVDIWEAQYRQAFAGLGKVPTPMTCESSSHESGRG